MFSLEFSESEISADTEIGLNISMAAEDYGTQMTIYSQVHELGEYRLE
jgi:hypothetical protein